MTVPHFIIDSPILSKPGDHIDLELNEAIIAHLDTLRMSVGQRLMLIDRPGHAYEIQLACTPNKKDRKIQGLILAESSSERTVDLTLVQGISTSDRMDQTIRQATELGVSRIVPFESERSEVRLVDATRLKKQSRWQRIAIAAAEQSAQFWYPEVVYPLRIDAVNNYLKGFDLILFFWEEGTISLSKVLHEHRQIFYRSAKMSEDKMPRITVLIGPEGGFSEAESRRFVEFGAREVSLGPSILRTETAAVVACTLVLYQLGALGGS